MTIVNVVVVGVGSERTIHIQGSDQTGLHSFLVHSRRLTGEANGVLKMQVAIFTNGRLAGSRSGCDIRFRGNGNGFGHLVVVVL